MKKPVFLFMFVFCSLFFVSSASAQCQGNIYISSLSWQTERSVHGFTATELDYCAGVYYDPVVSGSLVEDYGTGSAIMGTGYTEGYSDSVPANLNFSSFGPINNGTYTTHGDHYVIAYYQVYVPVYYDYYWYDPFGLGFAEGAGDPFYAPDEFGYYDYVAYWVSSPQFVGFTSDSITYTGQTLCLPGQEFTSAGQPCSSLPGCESGLQFSSTGEVCPGYVPPTNPPGESSVIVSFDKNEILPAFLGSSNTRISTCIVGLTGNKSGISVRLEKEIINENTGHKEAYHRGTRPKGTLARSSGVTNSNGCFETTYQAPYISAKVRVKATVPGYYTAHDTVYVRVSNLVRLFKDTDSNYRLNGSGRPEDCDAPQCDATYMASNARKAHESNHWVVPASVPALKKVADDYKNQFYGSGSIPPDKMVTYNDASLRWGGKFDLNLNWLNKGSHVKHRDGKNVDTKSTNIPAGRHIAFKAIANANNFGVLQHIGDQPHFHFKWGDISNSTIASTILQNGIDPNMTAINDVSIKTSNLVSNGAESIFERPVTQDEFELWYPLLRNAKTQGATQFLQQVKTFYQQSFSSQEYIGRFRTDEQFIEDVFESHLWRRPTEQELNYWMDHLSSLVVINEPFEPDLSEDPDFPEDPNTRDGGGTGTLSQVQIREMFLNNFENSPQFVNLIGNVTNDTYFVSVQ